MVNLINKRKLLLQCRKQKLREEYQHRGNLMNESEEISRISCYVNYPEKSKLVL